MTQTASIAQTQGLRITATPRYESAHSSQETGRYVFSYHIVMENESDIAVRLHNRYWKIIDSEGEINEVRGDGVVGEHPRLLPGGRHEYSSFCVLPTPFGTMEGHYLFEREDGDLFEAEVARFYLCADVALT